MQKTFSASASTVCPVPAGAVAGRSRWTSFPGTGSTSWAAPAGDTIRAFGEGEAARATVYVRTLKYLAPLLREYGIYYLANLVGFAGGVDTVKLADRDPDQLNRWADEITSGLRDEPNILGWFCADEARPTYLKNYLVTKAMIESRDRSKASMVLLNNLGFLKGFHESHQVIFTDQYPVLRRNRDDPWNGVLRAQTALAGAPGPGRPETDELARHRRWRQRQLLFSTQQRPLVVACLHPRRNER